MLSSTQRKLRSHSRTKDSTNSVLDKPGVTEQTRDKELMFMQDNAVKTTVAKIAKQAVSTERVLKGMLADLYLAESITKAVVARVRWKTRFPRSSSSKELPRS